MGFKGDLPSIDLGWATIYLKGDRIIITALTRPSNTKPVTEVTSTQHGAWVEVRKS